jgi:hypothetical protein
MEWEVKWTGHRWTPQCTYCNVCRGCIMHGTRVLRRFQVSNCGYLSRTCNMFLSFHGSRSIDGRISRPAMAPAWASSVPYRPTQSLIIGHTQLLRLKLSARPSSKRTPNCRQMPIISSDARPRLGTSTVVASGALPVLEVRRSWGLLGSAPREPTWLCIKKKGSALLV